MPLVTFKFCFCRVKQESNLVNLLFPPTTISYSNNMKLFSSTVPEMLSWKSATAGFLSGILRTILCSGTHTTEDANSVAKHQQFNHASKATPGIVARLMGLDSMPQTALLNPHTNLLMRSSSMNSADYNPDTASLHGKHNRLNSALSFRDMRTYFDKGSERNEQRSKESLSKGASGELKQRKENKENRVEKGPEEDDEQAGKRVLNMLVEKKMNTRIVEKPDREIATCREANDGAKLRKKMQPPGTQNVDPECSSEESSPVSVLVFDQFIADHDVSTSEEDSKAAPGLNPRRILSPELENYGCKSPCNDGNLMEDDEPKENNIKEKKLGSRNKDSLEGWYAICRVMEAQVAKSNWLCSESKDEQLEDVAADFGSRILDQLLDELVIQFSGSFPVEVELQ